jgi:hypothetical protein
LKWFRKLRAKIGDWVILGWRAAGASHRTGTIQWKIRRNRKVAGRKRPTLYVKNPLAHRLRKTGRPLNRTKVDAHCTRIGALPVADARAADEILGYDAFGIPR